MIKYKKTDGAEKSMVNIRKADKEDIYALIILWNELIMYHQNKMNNLPISKEWTDLKTKELEWIIESKRNIIYLVELGTNIIGYIKEVYGKSTIIRYKK